MNDAASGAAGGAAAGSVFGPWGAVAGGAAGGVLGYFNASSANRAAKKEYERQQEAIRNYENSMLAQTSAYGVNQQNSIDRYNQEAARYKNTPEGVAAWLNPAMDFQMQQADLANNSQYGAGGKLLSGAALKGLQDRRQNIAKLSWNDAFNMMNQSNNQGLGIAGNVAGMNLDLQSNMFNANQGLQNNILTSSLGLAAPSQASPWAEGLKTAGSAIDVAGKLTNAFKGK